MLNKTQEQETQIKLHWNISQLNGLKHILKRKVLIKSCHREKQPKIQRNKDEKDSRFLSEKHEQSRRQWITTCEVLKKKKKKTCPSRTLYSVKISFKNRGERKNFLKHSKAERNLSPTNLSYKENWSSLGIRKMTPAGNPDLHKRMKSMKMVNTCLSMKDVVL